MRSSKKELRRAAAEARAAAAHLKRAVEAAEKRLAKLAAEKTRLEAKLADSAVYAGPTAELMRLQIKHGEVKAALAEAEEAWLAAQAAFEEASALP